MAALARTEQILKESVGSELILYDQASQKAHRLNATAAFLWQHCDGTRGTAELAKMLHREMGIAQDEGLVTLALEQLQKQGLLKSEVVATGVTRREAIARLKAIGVAAAMIPVIATIAAPAPAAAASRFGSNTNRTATHSFFDDFWGKKGPKPSENGNNNNKGNGGGLGPWQNP